MDEHEPAPRAIDRTRPPYRDDPVVAVLTDEQLAAFLEVLVRLARSAADAELRRRVSVAPAALAKLSS